MELNDKVTQLEDEIKILKNEIQAVLLDLRESYLSNKNPFNVNEAPVMSQPLIITPPVMPAPQQQPDTPVAVDETPNSQTEIDLEEESLANLQSDDALESDADSIDLDKLLALVKQHIG